MPKATVEQTDSLVQSRIEQGRVADSFLQVFGLPASRSQAQKDVNELSQKLIETKPQPITKR